MRLRGVVLFAVAALVTGIDANLFVKSKETVASALSDQFNLLPLGGDQAPARRFLRATDTDEDDEEEEGVGPFASIVDKVKGLISTKSATESLEQWVTKGEPVNKVFSSLGLGKAGDSLFFNAKFQDWVKYVDAFNEKYPNKATSTIPTLISKYGDDRLFQLIEVAKTVKSTKTLALRLQGEYWAALGKSPDEVFNLFTLGAAGGRLFSKPEFAAWVKYVDDFNVKNPTKTTSTIPTLLYHHTDGTLAELIALAKKSDATNSIATKVGNAQMNAWLSSGKSADDVFMLLKLNRAENDFFKNPLYDTWTAYLKLFNEKYPDKKTDLFTTLSAHYRTKPLLKILEQDPSTRAAAAELRAKKLKEYMGREISPRDVFSQLGLEESKNVFSNPLFSTWLGYLNTFNRTYRKHESWYRILDMHLAAHLPSMIDAAMRNPSTEKIARAAMDKRMKKFLRQEAIPKKVFAELKLQKAGDGLVVNQNFEFWAKYVDVFNNRYPTQKTTILDSLSPYYKDTSLFQILEKAKKVANTKEAASTLQLSMMNKWVRAKQTPEDVAQLMNVEVSSPLVKKYALKFARAWGDAV